MAETAIVSHALAWRSCVFPTEHINAHFFEHYQTSNPSFPKAFFSPKTPLSKGQMSIVCERSKQEKKKDFSTYSVAILATPLPPNTFSLLIQSQKYILKMNIFVEVVFSISPKVIFLSNIIFQHSVTLKITQVFFRL
jgi:hypothetical protein